MTPEKPERWPIHIQWTRPAKRALRQLPEKVVSAAVEFIYGPLAEAPRRVGRPLRSELEGLYSAHRGDHRVIYRIIDEGRVVAVEAIAHRADIYRPR